MNFPLMPRKNREQTSDNAKRTLSRVRDRKFAQKLLRWYDTNARDLPWRKDRDPYRVWLSEIMLQQTRVATVLEHYRLFLEKFPTVQKLAGAREATVLAAWSGLGYYRRARMLHAAAKTVVREHAGRFPETSEGLRKLPGIGRYTAAAMASIAFREPIAVVDGNVERVLSRVCSSDLSVETLWEAAQDLLDITRPGDFNQAMMELGATVCTPRRPQCLICPVADFCKARGERPSEKMALPQKKREVYYGLAKTKGEVFLVQRRQRESLMAGMWELPELAGLNGETPILSLRHSITVTDFVVRVVSISQPGSGEGAWVSSDRLSSLPLTGLARKILRGVGTLPERIRRTSQRRAVATTVGQA
jgi:A/G-specific adenine glycosylase